MFVDSSDMYDIQIKHNNTIYDNTHYSAILGLFVTTHIMYNIILTITTYIVILTEKQPL